MIKIKNLGDLARRSFLITISIRLNRVTTTKYREEEFSRKRERERERSGQTAVIERRKASVYRSVGEQAESVLGSSFVETDFLVRRADRKTRDTRYGNGLERGYIAYVRVPAAKRRRRQRARRHRNGRMQPATRSSWILSSFARHRLFYLHRDRPISRHFPHFSPRSSSFLLPFRSLGRNFVGGSPLSRKGFSRYSVRKWSVAKREMVYQRAPVYRRSFPSSFPFFTNVLPRDNFSTVFIRIVNRPAYLFIYSSLRIVGIFFERDDKYILGYPKVEYI